MSKILALNGRILPAPRHRVSGGVVLHRPIEPTLINGLAAMSAARPRRFGASFRFRPLRATQMVALPDPVNLIVPVKCRIHELPEWERKVLLHGQAFHSSSFDVLRRGSNLCLLINFRVLPGGGKATEIRQRAEELQTH